MRVLFILGLTFAAAAFSSVVIMPKRMQTWKWIVFGRIKCTMTFSIAEMRDHVDSDDDDEWSC